MLTKLQKKELVKEISDQIKKSQGFYLVNFSKLATKELEDLRKNVKAKEGQLKVVKNTLLKIALKEAGYSNDEIEKISGQTIINFAFSDPIGVANVLNKVGEEKIRILGGVLEQKWLSSEEVKRIAAILSKEDLIAKLIGSLKSPMAKLVYVLKGNQQKLVYILQEVKNQRKE
ncbi:MAG TPA: 50S ribosomal protein L10 [Candidatus Paceibacterota bacterium]|nr:50S ribosomal protein L10 [Candidatus Paceibacterota bacterium]